MKKSLPILIFCQCFLAFTTLNAQLEEHFRAGVAAGVNFAQIAGDGQQGYHKLGPSIGVKVAYCLKPNFDMSTELLYNARGSRPNPFKSNNITTDKSAQLNAELNYADILLAANFHFMPDINSAFYRQSLQIGVSYGRLLSSTITVNRGIYADLPLETNIQDNVKKNDFGFVVGYTWFLTSRLGICAKHTFSLGNIYTSPPPVGSATNEFAAFTPYNISAQIVYNFIAPKLNIKAQLEKAKKAKERKNKSSLEEL
jgi:hypothetical protein